MSIASLRTFYTPRQTLYEHQLGPAPTWAFKISMNWFTSDQGLLAVVGQNLLLGTLIVAAVIFVETGLVVMPFLPGESRRMARIGAGQTVVAASASPENALEVFGRPSTPSRSYARAVRINAHEVPEPRSFRRTQTSSKSLCVPIVSVVSRPH